MMPQTKDHGTDLLSTLQLRPKNRRVYLRTQRDPGPVTLKPSKRDWLGKESSNTFGSRLPTEQVKAIATPCIAAPRCLFRGLPSHEGLRGIIHLVHGLRTSNPALPPHVGSPSAESPHRCYARRGAASGHRQGNAGARKMPRNKSAHSVRGRAAAIE